MVLELTSSALAVTNQPALKNPIKAETFGAVIEAIAKAVVEIGITVAGIFLIYSGFLFVSARGNAEQITKAKTVFFWTIIGALLVIGARVIATALNEFATGLQ